jgi:hypothetical protein
LTRHEPDVILPRKVRQQSAVCNNAILHIYISELSCLKWENHHGIQPKGIAGNGSASLLERRNLRPDQHMICSWGLFIKAPFYFLRQMGAVLLKSLYLQRWKKELSNVHRQGGEEISGRVSGSYSLLGLGVAGNLLYLQNRKAAATELQHLSDMFSALNEY